MLKLSDKLQRSWNGEPIIARVTTNPQRPLPVRKVEALLLQDSSALLAPGFRAYLLASASESKSSKSDRPCPEVISVPASLRYIKEGDIVRICPRAGEMSVLYRTSSRFNTMLYSRA